MILARFIKRKATTNLPRKATQLPFASMSKRKANELTMVTMDDPNAHYRSNYFRQRQASLSPLTLISFYNGSGSDSQGRTLDQILTWGTDRLERIHDYIQTLFPLPEKSGVNDRAPIINQAVFEAFRSTPELRERLRTALKKMLWFYGFELTSSPAPLSEISVIPGRGYSAHSRIWNTNFDHNHLRITRIIRCLRVLGLEGEARAFYEAVVENATRVSSRSKMYWKRAVERPLNIAPDVGEVEVGRVGVRWLWEFEREREAKEAEGSRDGEGDDLVAEGEASGEGSSGGETGTVVDGEVELDVPREEEKAGEISPKIDFKIEVREEAESPESIPETTSTEEAAEKEPSKSLEVQKTALTTVAEIERIIEDAP